MSYPVLVKTEHSSVLPDPRDEKIDDLPRAETADRRWQQEPRSRDRGVMCHALIVTVTWQQWLQLGQYYWEFLGSEGSTLLLFDCQNKISRKHKQSNSSRQRPDKCKYKQTNTGQPDAGVALWLRGDVWLLKCWGDRDIMTSVSWSPGCHEDPCHAAHPWPSLVSISVSQCSTWTPGNRSKCQPGLSPWPGTWLSPDIESGILTECHLAMCV